METPLQYPVGTVHGCPSGADHDREIPEIDRLCPLSIRGVTLRNRIVMSPMYQYSADDGLANDITGAVGLITDAAYANEIITGGDADLVFIVRELLREPYWALKAQSALGEEPPWPMQYGYAVKRRPK